MRALPTLYGGPEVLARARTLVEEPPARAAVDELELLCARLGALGPASRLSIDLGEVRGFDYYTGTRFALYAEGAGGALASGGRYDGLVARYGRPARAAGFALDVDRTAELLQACAACRRRGSRVACSSPASRSRPPAPPPSCAPGASAWSSISTSRPRPMPSLQRARRGPRARRVSPSPKPRMAGRQSDGSAKGS